MRLSLLSIGRNVRKLRKSQGLLQRDVAHQLGLQRGAIAHIERGVSFPSVTVLIGLCRVLDCTADSILRKARA